ncbi:unnamed protein product [Urochloa decumbens]|uniref:Uncharacterized protein n=1 Tax=Urochloa decumbens TaxID=240449 RepID=A0ABC9BYB8_9POAL
MATEDAHLRLALVAYAGNAAHDIAPVELASALQDLLEVPAEEVDVKPFHPENFLLVCRSQATRDRIFAAGRVPVGGTDFIFRQWTRLAHAGTAVLYTRTRDISSIPTSRPLEVAEPEQPIVYEDPGMQLIFGRLPPYLRQKKTLTYEILIRIRSVADFAPRSPSPSPSPPSSDGDSVHDGDPDRGYGESRGQGPRLQGFRPRRGVEDHPRTGFLPSRDGCSDDCAPASTSTENLLPERHHVAAPLVHPHARPATTSTAGDCSRAAPVAAKLQDVPAAADLAAAADSAIAADLCAAAVAREVASTAIVPGTAGDSNSILPRATTQADVGDDRRLKSGAEDCFPKKEKQSSVVRAPTTTVRDGTSRPSGTAPVRPVQGCTKDTAAICFRPREATTDESVPDPMLLEFSLRGAHMPRLIRSVATPPPSPLAPAARPDSESCGHSGTPEDQAQDAMEEAATQEAPVGDDQAQDEEEQRLEQFMNVITKHNSTPLAPKPARSRMVASEAPKRSSTRLATNKLAKIPAARRGEVLLMQRFNMEPSEGTITTSGELDVAFHAGITCGKATNVKTMFPSRKPAVERRLPGILA